MTAVTLSSMENLFGVRLRQARERRGLSMRDLQSRMTGGISVAAISKYEKGQMKPTLRMVEALSMALETPEDFFRRPLKAKLDGLKFRCKSSLLAKDENRVKGEAEDFFERYVELEDLLGMTEKFQNPLEGVKVAWPGDVEGAVERVRSEWRLGEAPIQSVVALTLQDAICPPSTQFAVFNNIQSKKTPFIYEDFGHEGLPRFADSVFDFLTFAK